MNEKKYKGLVNRDGDGRCYKSYTSLNWKLFQEDMDEQYHLMKCKAYELKVSHPCTDIRFMDMFEAHSYWHNMDEANAYRWASEYVKDTVEKVKKTFKVRNCEFGIRETEDGFMTLSIWCGSLVAQWPICKAEYWAKVYVEE